MQLTVALCSSDLDSGTVLRPMYKPVFMSWLVHLHSLQGSLCKSANVFLKFIQLRLCPADWGLVYEASPSLTEGESGSGLID